VDSYATGLAKFSQFSKEVTNVSKKVLEFAKEGDLLTTSSLTNAQEFYVSHVDVGSSTLFLRDPFTGPTTPSGTLNNIRVSSSDVPKDSVYNIISRMPSYEIDDWKAKNLEVLDGLDISFIEPTPCFKQDPLDSVSQDIAVGLNSNAVQGRDGVSLSISGDNEAYSLNNKSASAVYMPEVKTSFSKVYQSYVFDEESTGKLYLLVISGESDKDGTSVKKLTDINLRDCVALYELVGRPLLKGR
jgi:hypothetical protein